MAKYLKTIRKRIPKLDEISSRNVKIFAVGIIMLFSVLTVLGFFQMLGIKTQYNLRQFFPNTHPLLRQDDIVTEKFHLSELSPFLVVAVIPADVEDDWSNKEHLEAVRTLTEKIKTIQGVSDVKDISTLQGAVQTKGELGVGSIIDYMTPAVLKKEIHHNPILSPLFVSRDAHTLTIFVMIQEISTKATGELKKVLLDVTQAGLPFAQISIGGVPAIQADVNEMLSRELIHFIVVACFMSLIALGMIFRNFAPIFICSLSSMMTNIISVWGIMIFGFSFSVLSTTIPVLVTMTVVSICIHSILRVIERVHQADKKTRYHVVLVRTFSELFRPNLLTALTTSVGFFTLTLSESPIIKEFGLSVGIALLVTWMNSALLLPAFLLVTPKPVMRPWMSAKARWPFFILRFHKTILFSIIILAAFGAYKGQKLSWGARLFDDLPEDHAVRKTTELIDKSLGGIVPLDVEIRMPGGENPWSNQAMVTQLDALAKTIREKMGVGSVLTVADILKSSGLQNGATKASAGEVMFLLSMSGDNPLSQYISTDGLSTRLAIRLRDIAGSRMWNLVQEIRHMAHDQFPKAKIRMAGTGAYIHDINNALSKDLLYGFWQAMLVIFILLVISYRSLSWAILACLPNLTPPALLLGALALFQIPIKPAIAIILSISLGLAFNNTVYLLERLRQMMGKGVSFQRSLFHTFWSEANPCFFSSMVLIVGFASFSVSYFKMNQIFGVFMVLAVVTGLLGDLVMLPALLQFIFEKGHRFLKVPFRAGLFVIFCAGALFHSGPAQAVVADAKTADVKTTSKPEAKNSAAESPLKKLGEAMQEQVITRDEVGKIEMKVIEADGVSKKREISYSRLNDNGVHYTIMRMISPKDIKGTALLSVIKNEQEEKWIYLPSSKQTRKITTSDSSSARILDSELYGEDFDLGVVQGATSKITQEDKDGTTEVETLIPSQKSSYSKTLAWIGKDHLLKKAEVFDKKGSLLKEVQFLKYTQVGGGKWRASQINITNVQNKRKTELILSSVKVNQNLQERDFSTRALAEGF